MTQNSAPLFAYRSNDALGFACGPPENQMLPTISESLPRTGMKMATCSPCGQYFAWLCNEGVVLVSVKTRELVQHVDLKNVLEYGISPLGRYVTTFERMMKRADGAPYENVHVWEIQSGKKVLSFSHKNQDTWKIQWTEDESFLARIVTGEVQFYNTKNFAQPHSRLKLEGITEFSISPGKNPSVAVFVPEKKGAPAIVRLYGLLSFNYPLSHKTFFKADAVQFIWNAIGTNVLVLTQTETDASGQSYYGETNLYYLSAVGNYDCRVTLDATGPIHDICWGPNGTEFVVVYGNMPAKAALFDARANQVFDFGNSPKNFVRYSPKGRLILMAGFGNLAGNIEIWDRKALKRLALFKEDAAVYCEFLPDGLHILTATLSPRLRVDNRFRIRNYHGETIWQQDFKELFQIMQVPSSASNSDEFALNLTEQPPSVVISGDSKTQVKPTSAYVPPHLRKKMGSSSSLEQKTKSTSGAATSNSNVNAAPARNSSTNPIVADLEKKASGLGRKIRAIEQLKEKMNSGVQLEKNQLDKLSAEASLRQEFDEITAKLATLKTQ